MVVALLAKRRQKGRATIGVIESSLRLVIEREFWRRVVELAYLDNPVSDASKVVTTRFAPHLTHLPVSVSTRFNG